MVFLVVFIPLSGLALFEFLPRRTALPADPFDLDIGVLLDDRRATHGGHIAIGSGEVRIFHDDNGFLQLAH